MFLVRTFRLQQLQTLRKKTTVFVESLLQSPPSYCICNFRVPFFIFRASVDGRVLPPDLFGKKPMKSYVSRANWFSCSASGVNSQVQLSPLFILIISAFSWLWGRYIGNGDRGSDTVEILEVSVEKNRILCREKLERVVQAQHDWLGVTASFVNRDLVPLLE